MTKAKIFTFLLSLLFVIATGFHGREKTVGREYGNKDLNRMFVSGNIYEYHVVDLSIHPGTCIVQPGTYCKLIFDVYNCSVAVGSVNQATGDVLIYVDEGIDGYQPQQISLNRRFQ